MDRANVDVTVIDRLDRARRQELSRVLRDSFQEGFSFYRRQGEAEREVRACASADRRVCVALDDHDAVQGWIGAIVHDPVRWELHPLCVRPPVQGRGIGSRLVAAIEQLARDEGAAVMFLGTEDEIGATSLFDVDPYPDVAAALAGLQILKPHPISFYEKVGYRVTGMIPHAAGFGRHDFIMSRLV